MDQPPYSQHIVYYCNKIRFDFLSDLIPFNCMNFIGAMVLNLVLEQKIIGK